MSVATPHPSTRNKRRSARMTQLLARRAELGAQWAQQMSHARPESGTATEELLLIEKAIAEQSPNLAALWMPHWVIADAAMLHDPDTGSARGCNICAAEMCQQAA